MLFRDMSPSEATGNFPAATYPALHQRHWPSRRDKHLGLAFNLTLRSWCGGVFRGLTALDCLLPCSIRLFQLHAHGSVVEDAICGSRFQTEACSFPKRQRSTCGVEEPVARGTRITRPERSRSSGLVESREREGLHPFFPIVRNVEKHQST